MTDPITAPVMVGQYRSILAPEERGVRKNTGYRGDGKSFHAAQIENPALTAFFDFEKKGEGINGQLHFGMYLPVTEQAKGALAAWETFAKAIDEFPRDRFTHVVLDNTAPLEMALKAHVVANAEKYERQYGVIASNIKANKYGGASGVVNYLISDLICNPLWSKGVQLITVTSHVKPRWAGGVQVANSFNIKGADRWDELSVLTLIFLKGENAPIPSALVMKEQMGKLAWDEDKGEFSVFRRLPYRLPKATPAEIRRYLREPADLKNPKPGEAPTEAELRPFSEVLSREQLSILLAEIKASTDEADGQVKPATGGGMMFPSAPAAAPTPEPVVADDVTAKIRAALDEGLTAAEVVEREGVKMTDVLRVMRG